MIRRRTPEEIRWLKERGAFDVGLYSVPVGGFSKTLKYDRWDPDDVDDSA